MARSDGRRPISISTPDGIARLTVKQQQALETMVRQGLTVNMAAQAVGCSPQYLYRTLNTRQGRQYYERELEVLRSGERARNIGVAVGLREQPLALVGAKNKIEAMKFIEGVHLRDGNRVTVNVGVGVQVQPGYIIDGSRHAERAREIMQRAGSVRTLIDSPPDASPIQDAADE